MSGRINKKKPLIIKNILKTFKACNEQVYINKIVSTKNLEVKKDYSVLKMGFYETQFGRRVGVDLENLGRYFLPQRFTRSFNEEEIANVGKIDKIHLTYNGLRDGRLDLKLDQKHNFADVFQVEEDAESESAL